MKILKRAIYTTLASLIILSLFALPVAAQDGSTANCKAGELSGCGDTFLLPTICNSPESCTTAGINIIFLIAVVLALVYLIWGGVGYITSGGDEEAVGTAKRKITNAMIGLVIIILSWSISILVLNFFFEDGEQYIPVNTGNQETRESRGAGPGEPIRD